MDTRYNGWANYPTWCVALWLGQMDIDSLFEEWAERQTRYELAESIEEYLEELITSDEKLDGISQDLRRWALGICDFIEIADHYYPEES